MFMGSFMKADRKLDSIYELDPVFLKARGMKGIILILTIRLRNMPQRSRENVLWDLDPKTWRSRLSDRNSVQRKP